MFGVVFCGLLMTVPICQAANRSRSPDSPWVATWGAAMFSTDPGRAPDFSGQTLRQIVHTSVGGEQARVWLSNRFGSEPLSIGAAHIALSANESAIAPGSDHPLTFNGMISITIPPGGTVVSDPAPLKVPVFSNLAISIYLPGHALITTEHALALETSYAATGNLVDAPDLAGKAWPEQSWYLLSGVDVYAPGDSAVIAFGDSITDGAHSTPNENHRWPDHFAARLAADPNTRSAGVLGVVNVGTGGNRVLLDGHGPNAVSRVGWDALARSGARYMIVFESINDIVRYPRNRQPYGDLEAQLELGLSQLAAQVHQHGFLVFGATVTPSCRNDACASSEGQAIRRKLNQWICTSHSFDGFVDFDQAIRDPQHPSRLSPAFNSGDGAHPNMPDIRRWPTPST